MKVSAQARWPVFLQVQSRSSYCPEVCRRLLNGMRSQVLSPVIAAVDCVPPRAHMAKPRSQCDGVWRGAPVGGRGLRESWRGPSWWSQCPLTGGDSRAGFLCRMRTRPGDSWPHQPLNLLTP